MQSISLITITLIATALIGANAYLRNSPATSEDLRIGRQAMPFSEVKLMLHGGSCATASGGNENKLRKTERSLHRIVSGRTIIAGASME